MRYLLVFVLLTTSVSAQVIDGAFPVVSNLKAGVAKVDITPAEVKDVTVSSHTRVVNGVRDPLRAGVLVLDDGETKAAIVTLDVVGAWEDLVTRARAAIEKETGVPAANIMVCASHNHSGPGWHENKQWASEVIAKLASTAIADSYPTFRLASRSHSSAMNTNNNETTRRVYWTEQMEQGYPYLEMSENTPMRSPFVAPEFIENRLAITGLMEKHGFLHFPFEFWHYDKDDAAMHTVTGNPAPCRFGAVNWDPHTNEVTPVENPTELLNPLPVIEQEIAAALQRANLKTENR